MYFADVRLEDQPTLDDLFQYLVHRVKLEDQVKLANVAKAAVERLDNDLASVSQSAQSRAPG